jgi:hypothetical protein
MYSSFTLYFTCGPLRRFYYTREDFEVEVALLRRRAELPCVPKLFDVSDNADRRLRSPSGYAFPPYVVMERGATMREWLEVRRSFLTCARCCACACVDAVLWARMPAPHQALSCLCICRL